MAESVPPATDPQGSERPARWSAIEKADLVRRLARFSTTITELSDAREHAGRPRLSDSDRTARWYAPLWLFSAKGHAALVYVRRRRAELSVELTRPELQDQVKVARRALGLKGTNPDRWRLRELVALWDHVQLLLEP